MIKFTALVALAIVFSSASFAAGSLNQNYQCTGGLISGNVQIRLSHAPSMNDPFPSYNAVSNLVIHGTHVKLQCSDNLSYFKQEQPFHGGWAYDRSRLIYALCGANLHLNGIGEGLHLEVWLGNERSASGYLGHKDHDQSYEDNSRYDFHCSRL